MRLQLIQKYFVNKDVVNETAVGSFKQFTLVNEYFQTLIGLLFFLADLFNVASPVAALFINGS